jgi:hypothetical protein
MRAELIVIVAMIAAPCLYAVLIFNRLVSGSNQVREAWSGIDVPISFPTWWKR